MSADSPITVQTVKDIGLVFPIVAGVATLVRLAERIHSRRFGYDDAFAALSLSIIIVFVVALFIHLGEPTRLTGTTRVAMYYVLAQGFYGVLWTARLSILTSIIRITPPGNFIRVLYGLLASYVILWMILFSQVFWVCEQQPLWKDELAPQCQLGENVAIAQLITDIYADSVLIAAPLRLLWNLGVSQSQRSRLLLVFSSSITTTIASLAHAYYVLRVGGLEEVFVAILELSISLLVCNAAVLVGFAARFFEHRRGQFASTVESHSMSRSSRSRSTRLGRAVRTLDFDPTRPGDDTGVKVTIDTYNFDHPYGISKENATQKVDYDNDIHYP